MSDYFFLLKQVIYSEMKFRKNCREKLLREVSKSILGRYQPITENERNNIHQEISTTGYFGKI